MKNKVYENVLIGNFLYFLGYQSCLIQRQNQQKNAQEASVNLTQQTPADPLLGDVHLNCGGRNLLIEFKSLYDQSHAKETEKKTKINQTIKALERSEQERILSLSNKCHYLSRQNNSEKFELEFIEYLSPSLESQPNEMLNFSKKVLTEQEVGIDGSDFKEYLDILKSILDEGGRSFSTAGIHINISDDGLFTFTICSSIEELVDAISDALENTLTVAPQG